MIESADQRLGANRPDRPGPFAKKPQQHAEFGGEPPSISTRPIAAKPQNPGAEMVIGRLVQAAWRRRFLVVVPLLLMVPLSIAAAFLLPRTYIARTLLVMQESEQSNPLARDNPAPAALNQRVQGLDALLKSDQVLLPFVQGGDGRLPADTASRQKIEELRRDLSLELVGSDFLEIQLRGSRKQGLGSQLQQILNRFFEVLLAEDAPNAGQIIVQSRSDELKAAESARATVQANLQTILPAGLGDATHQLQILAAQLQSDQQKLDTAVSADEKDKLSDEIKAAETATARLKAKIAQYLDADRQLQASNRGVAALRETYQNYLNRYGNLGTTRGVGVLSAPGRIKVIDPPHDPLNATISRLRFLIAGLVGALLIGIGLAWLAEVLDSTVRYPEQLVTASGVPTLARLRNLAASSATVPSFDRNTGDPPARPGLRTLLGAAGLFIVIALAGYFAGSLTHFSFAGRWLAFQHWLFP
jgi:capsular polysaccharide biosynthesis protein